MIRQVVLAAAAAGVLTASAVQAQTREVAPAPTWQRVQTVAGAVETRITPNRPYSAEAVSETTQVLPDGNRISRTSVTKVYRDSAGRTRREVFGDGGKLTNVAISDPVAKTSFTLDPERKIAFKTAGTVATPLAATVGGGGGGRGGYVAMVNPEGGQRVLSEAVIAPAQGGTGAGRVMMRTPGPDNPNVKREDLGTQNVEGVLATGTRTTTTIPAGQIGNAQDIRIVSERWFSDELQVLVLTKHNDPRSGETVYRLKNILRAEPDGGLFAVPADYTVEERRIRRPQ